MDWTGLIKHGLTVFLFCQKLLLFFQSFLMIKNCSACLQWIIQKQKFSTEKMRAIWTISFKMRAKIKIQEQFSLCLTLQMSFLLSAMCVGSSFQFLFSPLKPCKLIRNRPWISCYTDKAITHNCMYSWVKSSVSP